MHNMHQIKIRTVCIIFAKFYFVSCLIYFSANKNRTPHQIMAVECVQPSQCSKARAPAQCPRCTQSILFNSLFNSKYAFLYYSNDLLIFLLHSVLFTAASRSLSALHSFLFYCYLFRLVRPPIFEELCVLVILISFNRFSHVTRDLQDTHSALKVYAIKYIEFD